MFDGKYIGRNDCAGEELCCGDLVRIVEKRFNRDFARPVLNYEDGTFQVLEIEYSATVRGKIEYDLEWCAFVFRPFDNAGCHYCRKLLSDYTFKEIWKEPIKCT